MLTDEFVIITLLEDEHAALVTVHINVFEPDGNPVTLVLLEREEVITQPPETIDQAPLPVEGGVALNVAVFVQTV